MKVISWNVNSLRVRISQIIEILKEEKPDVFCLQETKIINNQFPIDKFKKYGYFAYFNGIPSYNGVAILTNKRAVRSDYIDFCKKNDARHLSVQTSHVEIISLYVPAGGDDPNPQTNPKFKHKLMFLKELENLLEKKRGKKVILCGDLNIAPNEDDVWSHKQLINVVSHTEIERTMLIKILSKSQFLDSIRYFINPPDNIFTWWSYRSPNYKKNNRGRRLDHIWVSSILKNALKKSKILKSYRDKKKPSDHVPVCIELKI